MHPFSILGAWHLFSAYLCNITIFYETHSFIFFVRVYSFKYCKPFLNIRMGTICQVSLHDNNFYWYEMFSTHPLMRDSPWAQRGYHTPPGGPQDPP